MGSILAVLFLLPSVGEIVSIAGFLVVLIGVKYISDAAKERAVFNYMLIAMLCSITILRAASSP